MFRPRNLTFCKSTSKGVLDKFLIYLLKSTNKFKQHFSKPKIPGMGKISIVKAVDNYITTYVTTLKAKSIKLY